MIHISTKKVRILLVGLICSAGSASGMNLLSPYDPLIRPSYTNQYRTKWALFAETGVNTKAFNPEGCEVNVLRLWQREQNSLAMLNGFFANSSIGQFREKLDVDDNLVRGRFCVSGDLNLRASAAFSARFFFARDWSVGLYLPAYSMKLKNVLWVDQTEISDNPQDILTRECLTNDIFERACTLGCGLDLGGWERTGLGDTTLLLEWFRDFPQARPFLKSARLNWRLGIMFPTGKPWDEDKIMALPFGNDGAFAVPFGLGLDLTFGRYIRGGLDVQLTHIFGNTRQRRIKTDIAQTELLLLQKSKAFKDFGLLQRFELYFEFYRIVAGFSCKIGYEYFKKGEDTLSSCDPFFFNAIANSAERLEEFTMHNMVVNTWYDFGYNKPDMAARPEISFFARMPFNGKRSVQNTTVGGRVSLDF